MVYGVFDLPLKYADGFGYGLSYITNTSIYQMYQMTHRKGIHGGYLSRTYAMHPLFADLMSFRYPDLLIDGIPAPFANFLPALSRYGYRYVVLHTNNPDAPGVASARTLLQAVFGSQPPLVQDNLATVYQVAPKPGTTEARLAPANFRPRTAGTGRCHPRRTSSTHPARNGLSCRSRRHLSSALIRNWALAHRGS